MRTRNLILSVCLVVGVAGASEADPAGSSPASPPAHLDFSARFAESLPSWLTLGVEVRGRSDNYRGYTGVPDREESYYLHRMRINATIKAAPWMKFILQGQDSRVAGFDYGKPAGAMKNIMDLRQAYVMLGTEHAWTVRAGRQPLIFGDSRLISTSNWGNVGPNYDAFRVTRKWNKLTVDAFTGLVVLPCMGYDRTRMDKKLSAVYGSYQPVKGLVLDVYSIWKQNLRVTDENGLRGLSNIYTHGVRSTGPMALGFDYNLEMAYQDGHTVKDDVSAWAGHWEIGRRLQAPGMPRLWAEYNYSSGDDQAKDGRRGSFDQLYPTNVYGTATDFGWRNLHEPVIGLEWQINKKVKIRNAYHMFWLANRHDAVYMLGGGVYAYNPLATHSRVGSEFDTRVIYQPVKYLQIWAGYGHLFAGPFLKETSKSSSVDYPYFMWTFTF